MNNISTEISDKIASGKHSESTAAGSGKVKRKCPALFLKCCKPLVMTIFIFALFGTAMSGLIAKAALPGTTARPNSDKAIKSVVKDKKAPVIKLKFSNGTVVSNGGFSNNSVIVSVTDTNLSLKSVKKSGLSVAWPSSGTFTADGSYVISAKDKAGNISSSSFTIDKTEPVIKVKSSDGKLITNDGISGSKTVVTVCELNLSSESVKEDNSPVAWPSRNAFTTDGSYTVTVKDKAGNTATITFTIDNELNNTWSATDMDGLKVYEYGKTLLTTDSEKLAYDQIDGALLNLKSNVTVKANFKIGKYSEESSLAAIYSYVISDHPEFFYSAGDYDYTDSKDGGSTLYTLKLTYLYSSTRIVAMRAALDADAKKILAAANVKSTDLDKETAIHNSLLNICSYDNDASNAADFELYCDKHPDIITAYGAVIDNIAVCEGYAKAMKLLLDSEGIKTLYVTSADHAWNMAQISGKWYYLDATWDDTYSSGPCYDYFNFSSDSEAASEHDPLTKFDPTGEDLPENYQILPAA